MLFFGFDCFGFTTKMIYVNLELKNEWLLISRHAIQGAYFTLKTRKEQWNDKLEGLKTAQLNGESNAYLDLKREKQREEQLSNRAMTMIFRACLKKHLAFFFTRATTKKYSKFSNEMSWFPARDNIDVRDTLKRLKRVQENYYCSGGMSNLV